MNFNNLAGIYHFLRKNGKKEYLLLQKVGTFKKSDTVLEVGAGTGAVAKYVVQHVKHLYALDPSQNMLRKIKDPRIKKKVGYAQKTPFPNNTFDTIYIVDALHHFTNGYPKSEWDEQMNLCKKELLRVLKKNGQLLIVEFNPETFIGKCIMFFENVVLNFGSCFYTPKVLKNFFSQEKVEVFDGDKYCYILKIVKR